MKFFTPVFNYLSEVKIELLKVSWPSRDQTIKMAILVIIVSVATGVFLGGFDFLFSRLVGLILTK